MNEREKARGVKVGNRTDSRWPTSEPCRRGFRPSSLPGWIGIRTPTSASCSITCTEQQHAVLDEADGGIIGAALGGTFDAVAMRTQFAFW